MRYQENRKMTAKETLDFFSGFLNCLFIDTDLEDYREFIFDMFVENDIFRFQWSYLQISNVYRTTEEVHGFPIELINDEFERVEGYFEYDFKNTDKIAKEIINTINELSELPLL